MKRKAFVFSCFLMIFCFCSCGADNNSTPDSAASFVPAGSTTQSAPSERGIETAVPGDIENELTVFTEISVADKLTDLDIYKLAQSYMKLHPDIKVNVITKKLYDSESRLQTGNELLESLEDVHRDGVPDIIVKPSSLSIYTLAETGKLADIGALMDSDAEFYRGDYFENALDYYTIEGTQYFMPLGFSSRACVVNKKYVDFLPEPFEQMKYVTYQQMLDMYELVSKTLPKDTEFYMTDLMQSLHSMFAIYAIDVRVDSDNPSMLVNTVENVKALEAWAGIPAMPDDYSVASETRFISSYFNKDADFLFGNVDGTMSHPEVWMPYWDAQFTTPILLATGKEQAPLIGTGPILAIVDKNEETSEIAWDFVKYCVSEKEDTNELLTSSSVMKNIYPVNINNFKRRFTAELEAAYELQKSKGRVPDIPKDEAVAVALDRMLKSTEYVTKRFSSTEVMNAVNGALNKFSLPDNEQTAAEVLAECQAAIDGR